MDLLKNTYEIQINFKYQYIYVRMKILREHAVMFELSKKVLDGLFNLSSRSLQ